MATTRKPIRAGRPTLKDIAQIAGVSLTTVSRALQNRSDISLPTTQRIQKIAGELGYVHNSVAKSLRSQQTHIVGLVVADSSNPFFGPVIKGAEYTLAKNGYSLIVSNTDEIYDKERAAIEVLLGRRVDGILITPTQSRTRDIEELVARSVPIVLVGRRFTELEADYVVADDDGGARSAIEHLVKLGHSRILFLDAPPYISSAVERRRGYEGALETAGIERDESLIQTCNPTLDSAYHAMRKVLVEGVRFTAVFCFNDIMLLGALRALREANVKVPENVSVVGFDDIEFTAALNPPVTTVRAHPYEIGVASATALISRMGGRTEPLHQVIPTELIVRESTARVKTQCA